MAGILGSSLKMAAHSASPPLESFLSESLSALSLPASAARRLSINGNESMPSRFATTDLIVASIATVGIAVSELLQSSAQITVNRHLACAWSSSSLRPIGWELPGVWDAIAGDYRTKDGWIRLHTNAAHHRRAAQGVLGGASARPEVARVVASMDGNDLASRVIEAGGCAATMNSLSAWRESAVGKAVASEPLIDVRRCQAPRMLWRPSSNGRPLRGIKVLDLTRIIAGPLATRCLAGLGADVVRIDPPGWDEPAMAPEMTLGKTCAMLDLSHEQDRGTFEALLTQADILVHGYRPGALERLGYGKERRTQLNPGLVDVSLNAYGWTGPWSDRRGFDSLVQMSAGIAWAGMEWKEEADRPVPLPVQALDVTTGYLMAAAAIRGLQTRIHDDMALDARLSLARTAHLLISQMDSGGLHSHIDYSGTQDNDYGPAMEHTTWGPAHRLCSPLTVGNETLHWDTPARALGSDRPSWRREDIVS